MPVTIAGVWPWSLPYSSIIHAIVWALVPTSGRGDVARRPEHLLDLVDERARDRCSSAGGSAPGRQLIPPLAPPNGIPAIAVFQVISVGERAHLVEVDLRVVADAALVRAARAVVLHAVAVETWILPSASFTGICTCTSRYGARSSSRRSSGSSSGRRRDGSNDGRARRRRAPRGARSPWSRLYSSLSGVTARTRFGDTPTQRCNRPHFARLGRKDGFVRLPSLVVVVVIAFAALVAPALASRRPRATCPLGANGKPIKHVIYLQFDNTHFSRDSPNVPSDLEQMPHLLELPEGERHALHERPHDPDLAHRGRDPRAPHRPLPRPHGPDGLEQLRLLHGRTGRRTSRARSSTGRIRSTPTDDPLPNMITDGQKTTPAPWVPFTRAGCDVGGVGTANIELENTSTDADRRHHEGVRRPARRSANEAERRLAARRRPTSSASPSTARRPSTSVCARQPEREARPAARRAGRLQRLQGALRREVRRPGDRRAATPCVNDTERRADHRPGRQLRLPGLRRDAREEHARLRRRDAGDRRAGHVRRTSRTRTTCTCRRSRATRTQARRPGPARSRTSSSCKDYDNAFASVLHRTSQQHGINKSNTLFVDHRRRGRPLRRRHRHAAAAAAQPRSTTTARAPT